MAEQKQPTTRHPQPTNIVLIGYRGSGKTTLAKLLANRLGWGLFEADDHVVKAAGKSIKAIFQEHGEPHFRALEAAAVAHASSLTHHVISLGGGAVMAEPNRQAITAPGHLVVYLKADPAELLRRIQADTTTAAMRPNLTTLAGGIEEIRTLLAHREPIYRELATVEMDVTGKSPESVAGELLNMIDTDKKRFKHGAHGEHGEEEN